MSKQHFVLHDGQLTPIKNAQSLRRLFGWGGRRTFHNDDVTTAYSASAVAFRCINLIAETLATIPLYFSYTHPQADGNQELPPEHPLRKMLSADLTRIWQSTTKDLLIFGNAFWYYNPYRRNIERINPRTITVQRDWTGLLGFVQRTVPDGAAYDPEQLVYFYEYNPDDDLYGLSRTLVALQAIGVEASLDELLDSFLTNGGFLSGILSTDQMLTETESDTHKSRWEHFVKGVKNAGRTAILGKGLTYQPLSSPLKDMALDVITNAKAVEICQIFGVPPILAFVENAANFATAQEMYRALYTGTIIPLADGLIQSANIQLAPHFTDPRRGSVRIALDLDSIEVLQENRAELTARAIQSWQSGIASLNEARAMEGYETLNEGGDVFFIGGQLFSKSDLASGNITITPPQTPGGFTNPFMQVTDPHKDAPALEPEKTARYKGSVVLQIGDDPDLSDMQAHLQGRFGEQALRWLDPDEFHLTLLSFQADDKEQLIHFGQDLKALTVPKLSLELGSLKAFDTVGEHALHFRIRRNPDLLALQAECYALADFYDLRLKQHSRPDDYVPHITLGYAEDRIPSITYRGKVKVQPASLDFSIGDGDEWQRVLSLPCGGVDKAQVIELKRYTTDNANSRFVLDPQLQLAKTELKNWQRKVKKQGIGADFNPEFLPPALADFIRMDVQAAADNAAIQAVFQRGLKALEADDPELATPEEFEAYWQGIGRLYDLIRDAFLAVYGDLNQQTAALISGMDRLSMGVVDDLLAERAEMLITTLTPVLARVYMAGLGRGNDLLLYPRETANPLKQVDSGALFNVAWDIYEVAARDWAGEYAFDLVGGITDTTLNAYRDSFTEWIEKGGTLPDLAEAIQGRLGDIPTPPDWSPKKIAWATSFERAALIAQTETTRAFQQGVERRWTDAGVQRFRWRTQNDSRVCSTCRGLNNKEGDLAIGIDYRGKIYKPPAHVGCRCFSAPIASSIPL